MNAILPVCRDHIGRPGDLTSDQVEGGPGQQDTVEAIAQRLTPGNIHPNKVALNHVVARQATFHRHAALGIAGDDVAGGGVRAADDVSWNAADANPGKRIAEASGSAHVRADEIALDDGATSATAPDVDAAILVGRNDIP